MAKGSRTWKAGELGDNVGFRFQVTDADDLLKAASENFIEHQAKAWRDIREWADDQIEIVGVQEGGSPNGPGASLALTVGLREELPKLWARHDIHSVLDVACGDWNWMRHVDLSGITNYFGWDVDEEMIDRCTAHAVRLAQETGEQPHTWFEVRNIADTDFPDVDCILAREILIHFPNDYIAAIIDRMHDGGARYLLTDNFPTTTNDFIYDPAKYTWMGYMERPVNLDAEPFGLAAHKVDAIQEQDGPAGVLTIPHEMALYRLRER